MTKIYNNPRTMRARAEAKKRARRAHLRGRMIPRSLLLLILAIGVMCAPVANAETPEEGSRERDPSTTDESAPPPSENRSGGLQSARGFSIGNTGLNIGGFSNIEIDRVHGEPLSIELGGINFLVLYEPIEAFRMFAELEVGDLLAYETGEDVESDVTFEIERLYAELSLDDPINIRAGRFLTPIGRWNLVFADPFVWTASDPVMLDTAFDEHQTGIALTGSFFPSAGTLEYWLYSQVIESPGVSDTPPPGKRSVGGRIEFTKSLEGWSVGSSFLASERNGEWSYLGGFDAEIQYRNFELLTEFVYQDGAIAGRDLIGIYAQGRYEIISNLSIVSRYEYFNRIGTARDDVHVGDVGFAWQPRAWLILKATYRFSSRETVDVQRGLSSSISVVF